MSGVAFTISLEDARARHGAEAVVRVLTASRPLYEEIAAYGEASTRQRFESGVGPDGSAWRPSLRARLTGGKTLVDQGLLRDSISGQVGEDHAEWGSNLKYAAIHHEGGEIVAQSGHLSFRLADGSFRRTKSVSIPARPYLGISAEDAEEIPRIVIDHVRRAAGEAGGR